MEFPFFASPNFTPGRKKEIKAIIVHRTFGSLEKTVRRCFDADFWESFHFLISQEGKIVQLVKCQDTAWHCGWISNPQAPTYLKPNPNFSSIGIACEDRQEGETADENFWTPEQENSLRKLLTYLQKNLGIQADSRHIFGHSAIDPQRSPQDPGPFLDWDKIIPDNFNSVLPKEQKRNKFKLPKKAYSIEQLTKKLFYGILNREPNLSELDYYKYSGLDVAQIAGKLARTEEFRKKILG